MKTDRVMVFFVCDREKCERCYPECRHTLSLFHAKYETHDEFEPDTHGNLWEVERKEDHEGKTD